MDAWQSLDAPERRLDAVGVKVVPSAVRDVNEDSRTGWLRGTSVGGWLRGTSVGNCRKPLF